MTALAYIILVLRARLHPLPLIRPRVRGNAARKRGQARPVDRQLCPTAAAGCMAGLHLEPHAATATRGSMGYGLGRWPQCAPR